MSIDVAQILEDLTVFERSVLAVSENFDDLVAKYNNQWVALHNGVVVSNGSSHQYVLREVDQMELRRSQTNIRFMTDSPPIMIL